MLTMLGLCMLAHRWKARPNFLGSAGWPLTLSLSLLVLFGCGGAVKQAPAVAGEQGTGANLAANCTKTDCDPANMMYEFSYGLVGTSIEFEKDVDNNIIISGSDADGGTRRVYVLVGNFPKGAIVTPDKESGRIENSVSLNWTPDSIQRNKAGAPFKVVLRDYDRCVVEHSEEECQQYKELSAYDQSHEFSWEVVKGGSESDSDDPFGDLNTDDSEVVEVSDPDCDGFVPTTDGDIMSQGLSTGVGILSGLGSGGFDPSILTSLFTGMSGANQTAVDPDEC